ncbi:hypothetical protein Tco_1193701 [Tanacetum coccineum]
MVDPNITMEEYIRLEKEKARRRGKVYNWETATYGKIWDNEDVHDLGSVETEFPVIVFNNTLTSEVTLSCEPTVSSLNDNEIDFRISFDESDDEDYTVIYDKNSFSYKIISVNDLKTDSENDNEKVNMPSFSSPEHTVSCLNDLDFFKDFENKFSAIVYNDALTSKSDFSTEPTLSPQNIDEFDLKDETSMSECDEEEQNVLYFNDLFPFNTIYPDDSKSDKDNDNDKIDIKQSSGNNVINTNVDAYTHESNKLLKTNATNDRYCRGNRSDSRVKHELSNLKVPDQTKDRALATESATFVTSYSLNVAAGLPHNFSIPNFSLEGDGVHSQLFNWLVFQLMKSKVIRDLEKAR